ncbi:hypothetical protein DUNSADRAFT_7150 [Dunaliella salina]|uniref:SAP domain-containing protein n=1 Tax=Dunaliella salina TaxID=3046 RepID=A0ABQ7GLY3_DUNSA|nr:hypothetical protein DUNSADRAFT_7150 [Dunaliella salina]|eukprot:KAF5835602.1 hypothetical protein DUNSADRAFT_7150 [Dunaliella salina]
MQPMLTPADADAVLRPVLLKDLRIQCRARGLTPAGGQEALRERLKEHMLATGDFTLKDEQGKTIIPDQIRAEVDRVTNNYARPDGQNVGNYLTDRNTSRVLAPPGGHSQISLGGDEPAPAPRPAPMAPPPAMVNPPAAEAPAPAAPAMHAQREAFHDANVNNNYSRPAGQNVGNFLTDRNSSRVLAPPGGASQITFG